MIRFEKTKVAARFTDPNGEMVEKQVEVRVNPLTFRTSRVSVSRMEEKEPGTDRLPPPPPEALRTDLCPFCRPRVFEKTPKLDVSRFGRERLEKGESLLFPNLYPYGAWSAVSLFDNTHFVEIGTARPETYADSFINAGRYLSLVKKNDPQARHMAITQNHLPSAGGSLVHPHLQINADAPAANHFRFLINRAQRYYKNNGSLIFSDLVSFEKNAKERWIGVTGNWQWIAAYAPEGFFEIWGILPGAFSLTALSDENWLDLSRGICFIQRFFKSLNRNGYNLGLLSYESPESRMELRAVLTVRANFAPYARNDHTGFEVMLGDMTTFTPPEKTARLARSFAPVSSE